MKKKQEKKEELPKKEKRNHRVSFMLNDTELKAVQRHFKKYKIKNNSNWYRRTILAHIWKKLEEDYPMLFNAEEMRQ